MASVFMDLLLHKFRLPQMYNVRRKKNGALKFSFQWHFKSVTITQSH